MVNLGLSHLPNKTIAFSHYSVKNDISGVTTWLERLLLRLHNDGFPVVVYLQHFGSDVEESSLLHSLRQAGIPVEIELRSSYIEGDIHGTLAFLNRHQPQVFIPQCLEAMYYTAGIASRAGLPWAMTFHSDDPVYWAIAETIPPETNGGLMIGVSDYIWQKIIEKRLANHPLTIPCGVPLPHHRAFFSNSPFRIAFSGRVVEKQKRISLVLAAMTQACHRDARIECCVLGDGAALAFSQQWVLDQGLGDRIHFLGRLEPSAVQAELAQCQALLLMSDYEGLPVALLEAMAIGVVPVVRAIPSGIPELVKNNETGLLVDDTPEQAASAIIHLADRPNIWSQCSTASKLLVAQNYSEEVCYQRWLKVIAELCDRSTIQYPIPIPRKILLPETHPGLGDLNKRRKPPFINCVFHRGRIHLGRLKVKLGSLRSNFIGRA